MTKDPFRSTVAVPHARSSFSACILLAREIAWEGRHVLCVAGAFPECFRASASLHGTNSSRTVTIRLIGWWPISKAPAETAAPSGFLPVSG